MLKMKKDNDEQNYTVAIMDNEIVNAFYSGDGSGTDKINEFFLMVNPKRLPMHFRAGYVEHMEFKPVNLEHHWTSEETEWPSFTFYLAERSKGNMDVKMAVCMEEVMQ